MGTISSKQITKLYVCGVVLTDFIDLKANAVSVMRLAKPAIVVDGKAAKAAKIIT
jgi:hypothetical protein